MLGCRKKFSAGMVCRKTGGTGFFYESESETGGTGFFVNQCVQRHPKKGGSGRFYFDCGTFQEERTSIGQRCQN